MEERGLTEERGLMKRGRETERWRRGSACNKTVIQEQGAVCECSRCQYRRRPRDSSSNGVARRQVLSAGGRAGGRTRKVAETQLQRRARLNPRLFLYPNIFLFLPTYPLPFSNIHSRRPRTTAIPTRDWQRDTGTERSHAVSAIARRGLFLAFAIIDGLSRCLTLFIAPLIHQFGQAK